MWNRKARRAHWGASLRARLAPGLARSRMFLAPVAVLGALVLGGCGGYCDGPDCGCEGQEECIVSCERDGCDIECSHAGDTCGAICGDDCDFRCHDTDHCSSFSGDGSIIECHGLVSCAAECGANCDYSAHDVTEINITVGPASTVECRNLSACNVECTGECQVECSSVSFCEVECPDGRKSGGPGSSSLSCD